MININQINLLKILTKLKKKSIIKIHCYEDDEQSKVTNRD